MRVERVVRQARAIVGVRQVVALEDLADFVGRAYAAVSGELARLRVRPAGPAVALFVGEVTEKADVVAGLPLCASVEPGDAFVVAHLPGGPTIETVHHGTYDDLEDTYCEFLAWMAERDLEPAAQMWEEYLAGPYTGADPARWCTRIVFPLA